MSDSFSIPDHRGHPGRPDGDQRTGPIPKGRKIDTSPSLCPSAGTRFGAGPDHGEGRGLLLPQ
jgi:hypothetical protein